MKKIIILIVLLLIVVGIGIWIAGQKKPQDQTNQTIQFPISSGASTSVSTAQNNFLSNPELHQDPNNSGYYFVGYQPSDATAPYLIKYIAETHYFTVAVAQEPIGENRRRAEQYLAQLLGATHEQMCSLNYAVYVSNTINSQYSGENLGFSFCPGAVKLPN